MISFLNPLLLLGILGASIPIIIHLINKKKAVSHKFAAIDFLFHTDKRISVKFKLRQLILLILRTSLIVLLALALARPFIKGIPVGASEKDVPTSNVFLVDDSYSMQYAGRSGSFFASAKNTAKEIIGNLTKNDNAAVLPCSIKEPQLLPELDYDKNNLLNLTEQLQPGYATTHITPALDAAVEILSKSQSPVKRIFLLTDLARNGWDFNWFKSGHEKLRSHVSRVHIIDLSEGKSLKNTAVTRVEPALNPAGKNDEGSVKVTVSNFSDARVKNLLAEVFLDQKKIAQGFFTIEANASESKEFSFPLEKGKDYSGWIEISKDNLAVDDKRYFTITTAYKLDVLLVDGDPKTNIYESETFYLEKALNPGREHASAVKPVICSVHEAGNFAFADFNVVFLCNVETLPIEKIRELEKFVKEGGAVVFSLGNKVDAGYYNNALGSLLPHRLHATKTFSGDNPLSGEQPLRLKVTEPPHPALNAISGANMGALPSAKFYRVFYVDPAPQGNCKTILSYSDDTPAVVERQIERGKAILFTTSIDRDWSDLPVKPFFLPLMQQVCRYASGHVQAYGDDYNEVQVMGAWQFPCPYECNNLEITNPDGEKTVVQPQLINNETFFSYHETRTPGVYAVTVDGKPHPQFPRKFTVNVDTAESNLDKIDRKELTPLMGGTNLTIASSQAGKGRDVLVGEAKKTLWGAILFFALCVFFIESFISRR